MEVNPIICDNGSGYLKMGYAGQNLPSFTIPGIIGRPMLRSEERIGDFEIKSIMIGDEVTPVRSMLELTYPITEGIVTNWEDMELLWRYAFFQRMKIKESEAKDQKIMLTEAAQNPKFNREKMAEIMFEKLGFGYLKIEVQAILSLFAEGLMSGIVLDSGDGVTHCIPIFEGYILPDHLKRLNAAGRHVTSYLVKLLLLRGYAFNSSADFETVKEIKEGVCYVANSIAADRRLAQETTVVDKEYKLPDGTNIIVGRERFEAPECLFNPSLIDDDKPGVSEMLFESINESPIDCRKEFYSHILLTGGTTMYPGFPSRVEKDIKDFYSKRILKGKAQEGKKTVINVIDPPRRRHGVFIGASFYADNCEHSTWVSKATWDEQGARCVHTGMGS